MNADRHGKRGDVRRLAVVLGVYALLLRCLIAPGVMPDAAAAAHGVFKLIICTGYGIEERSAPQDGPAGSSHQGDAAICAYAAAGHLATAPDIGMAVGDALRPVYASAAMAEMARPAPLYAPGARAPPFLA